MKKKKFLAAGYSEIVRSCGMSRSNWMSVFRDGREITLKNASEVARRLGISLDELSQWIEERRNNERDNG